MFDTCTAANRIIDQPLLTTFVHDCFKAYTSGIYTIPSVNKYTRIRRASYKYVGCTHAAALTKAKELNLLYNRKINKFWTRNSSERGYTRSDAYSFVRAADVKIVLDHDIAYNVEVSLDEELWVYYNRLDAIPRNWVTFENNPDLETGYFKYNGQESGTDFEYDGILPSS